MSRFRASQAAEQLAVEVTRRLRESGLATWRFTPDGAVDGPDPEGGHADFIRASALEWLRADHTGPIEHDGDWFLPHPIRDRRAEAGLVVCELHNADLKQAALTSRLIDSVIAECRCRVRDSLAVDAFTEQLGNAYEYTALLYRIGRNMTYLNEPRTAIQFAIDELTETAEFGWCIATIVDDEYRWLGDPSLTTGRAITGPITTGAEKLASSLEDVSIARIVDAPELVGLGLRRTLGRQVLVQPVVVREKTAMMLLLGGKRGEDPEASSYDTQLIEAVAGSIATLLDTARFYNEQEELYLGVITSMTSALDAKDRYTRGHSDRVASLSRQLALRAGATPRQAERIYISGLLHDIGKIGVPERILQKQGPLTADEFATIKLHPVIGRQILHALPGMSDVLPGVLYHHERWDGRGYPHGLAGAGIPWMARVMALADTFDAMSSDRAYRNAMSRERVLREIRDCAGSQFDPELAEHFLKLDFGEYDRLVAEHRDAELGRPLPMAHPSPRHAA